MIILRDMVAKCEKFSNRLSFIDDVVISEKVSDVTDLITYVRDALCHIDSQKHLFCSNKITYCIACGKGNLIKIGDKTITSDYNDDICFIFGEQKIYLKRHIFRAV